MEIVIAILFGIVSGLASGLIPGIGNFGIMLIGFPIWMTFGVSELVVAYAAMSAIGQFIGSVPATLFGVPGESSSLPAVIEGHKMYKDGRGSKAIIGSAVGSWLGSSVTIILSVAFLAYAMHVVNIYKTPIQFAFLVAISLMLCLTKNKQWWSSTVLFSIGIMLAIVGYDNTLNTSVLTFNNAWLWNGIPMVIIIFCLFAVPQIFAVNYNVQPTIKQTNTFKDVYYTLAKWPTIVRSSVIGYFCGFIPSLTYVAGTKFAYAFEQWIQKKNQTYNKQGDANCLIAAETANNAGVFTQLLPLLILGVPLVGSEALLLNLAEIKGFTLTATNFQDLILLAVCALLIANTVGLILGWPMSNLITKFYKINSNSLKTFSLVWMMAILLWVGYSEYSLWYYCILIILFFPIGVLLKNYNTMPLVFGFMIQDRLFETTWRFFQLTSHGW